MLQLAQKLWSDEDQELTAWIKQSPSDYTPLEEKTVSRETKQDFSFIYIHYEGCPLILQAFGNITGTPVMWTESNLSISPQLPTWDVAGIQMCYSIMRFEAVCMLHVALLSIMHLTSQPWQKSKSFINRNCIYFSSLDCFLSFTLLLNGFLAWPAPVCVICSENRGAKLSSKAPVMDSCNRIAVVKPCAMSAGWWGSATGPTTLPQLFQAVSFHLQQLRRKQAL